MSVSFRDYITISEAFLEVQLDEGAIWDAIKKKLGGKVSDEEIEAEIERLKKIKGKDLESIKKTAASRDFHARKAASAKPGVQKTAIRPRGTIPTGGSKLDAIPSNQMRAGQARAAELEFALGEETLTEGIAEFVVTYTSAGSDRQLKARIKGRDVREVRRKFNDTFFKKQIVGIEPAKPRKM